MGTFVVERTQEFEFVQWTGDNYDEVVEFLSTDEDFNGTYFLRGPDNTELVIDNNNVGAPDFTVAKGSYITVVDGSAAAYTAQQLHDDWGYDADDIDEDDDA